MTNRRQACTAAASALLFAHLGARAQERPVEGKQYMPVSPRQRTRDTQKVEVIEFFAYSCHHCAAFEPDLEAWRKTLPADVDFRRIPVAFRQEHVMHQALYLAIEAMGLVDQLHAKVFHAIHEARPPQHLATIDQIVAFMTANGADLPRFIETMNSFSLVSKVRQAAQITDAYKIDGTPSLAVDGRWTTSGALTGTHPRALPVVDYLIGVARTSR